MSDYTELNGLKFKKKNISSFDDSYIDIGGLKVKKDIYDNRNEYKRAADEKRWKKIKKEEEANEYHFGDFTRGLINSGIDLAADLGEGFLGTLEGIADWGTYRVADIGDFVGATDFANDLRQNADFNSVGALFGKNENVQDNLFKKGWTEGFEKYSIFNDTFDQIFQGVGNVAGLAAITAVTGGSNLATIGASYTSAYGNARSKAKREGASDRDANRAGIINGIAEALSEQFFEGMPGLNVEGWGSKLTGKFADKVSGYFGTTAGKIALKTFDALGEGTEEIISNSLVAIGNDLMQNFIDKNYTYGMEGQTGNILEDAFAAWTNSESWSQFFSAAMTSALLGSAKGLIDTRTQNKIINAYAKDNSMSFRDAKYILTGQMESAKQELQRDNAEYNSNVELENMAKQRILNYMKNTTGKNIEAEINSQISQQEQELGTKFTDEQREQMRTEIRTMYEDRINSQNRYQEFTLENNPTNDKDKGLYESFRANNRNNTKETHEIYNFIKTLQDNNPTSKYRLTSNEELVKMGELERVEQDGKVKYLKNGQEVAINGFKKGDTIYINADAVNPYQATIGHEIGEAIKASDKQAYDSLKKLVKQVYGEGNLDDYKQIYGENLTDNVEDEYVNDKLGELFKDNKLIERISNNRNLLQRLIDEVKRLVKYVKSNAEQRQLQKLQKSLQDKYIELYKEADFNKGSENTSFSLDEDLEKYVYPQQVYENFKYEDKSKITQSVEELEEYKKTLDTDTDEGWSNNFTANAQIRALNAGYDNLYDYYVNQEKERLKADAERGIGIANRLIEEGKKNEAKNNQLQEDISKATTKQNEQFEIIQKTNPAPNDQLVWIRSPLDIKTFEQVVNEEDGFSWGDYSLEDAKKDLKRNKVRVYSSYAIKDGTFVSTSYQQALDYAGGDASKVHSREINPSNVAWISGDEGQYANTNRTRYSLSVADLNTGLDNNGNKLSQGQREYFKDSKATNEEGDLIQVYHTTTDDVIQFNEFNPVGTPYYKFGDQVVNYFTDSKEMSGSYADNYYEMADTKKLNTLEEAQIWLDSINSDLSIENNNIYGDNIEPEIKYENEEQLLKYLKSDVQRLIGEEARIQYQGYVNIINPYVIDAEGRYWNKVESKGDTEKTTRLINTPAEIKQELIDMANDSIHSFDETYFNWKQADNAVNYVARDRTNVTLEQRILNRMIHELEYQDVREILDGKGSWGKKISFMDFLHHEDFITEQEYQEFKKTDKISQEILDRINNKLNAPLKYEDRYMANELEALGLPLEIKETTLNDLWRTREEAYKAYDENGRDESSQFVKKMMKAENELKYSRYGKIDDLFYVAKNDFTDDYIRQQYNDWSVTNDIVKKIIDLNNYGENYDGVIIKNVVDYGGRSDTQEAHDLYITFNSNQFKAIDNLNPTEDSDIRYQLTQNQNQQSGFEETEQIKDYTDYIESLNLPATDRLGILTEEDYKNKKKELYEQYVDRAARKIDEQVKDVARRNLELKKGDIAALKAITDKYSDMTREDIYSSNAKEELRQFVKEHSHQEYEEQIINDEIRNLQKEIRSREFIISDQYKGEFADGLTKFKKNNPGINIKFGQKGNLDTQLQELAELYPGQVNADVSYGDIPYVLADIMKQEYKQSKIEEFNLTDDEIDNITNKMFFGLTNNALSDNDIDKFVTTIQDKIRNKYARQMAIKEYRQLAKDMLGDITQIKDKKRGLLYQINTMKRNLRDIMTSEQATRMYDVYFKPISIHNAQIETDINEYNDRISKYNLNNEESTYTQMLGELKYNPDTSLITSQVDDYLEKHKNRIDTKKVNSAIEEFREIYDELIGRVNEALEANGYKPIDYRTGYFPHFIEDKATSMLGKFAEKLGFQIKKGQLPTDIAGITDEFQPGKVWTSFSQQRTGDATDYNALKGMDNYLRGAMDVIYHTQDIQRLRALEAEIRYQYSDKGVQQKLDEIYNNQDLTNEEKYAQAALITDNVKNNPLGNFATELRNYTNNLANKKAIGDRGMEQTLGRDMYSIMNNISSRVSANMVGANISSAMTNFIPITQAWSQVKTKNMLKGILTTIKASIRDDGFSKNSIYLTNRTKQADRLFKTKTEKATDFLGKPFEAIDSFTSNVIVRSKYYENLDNGMNEVDAMNNADEFAKDVMAGRSKGDAPTMFNKKNPLTKLFTAFQLEVNNQYGYMFKDIKTDIGKEAKDKLAMAFMKMFIGAWIYNMFSEKITGRKAAFSPIDMAIDDAKIITNENMDLATKLQNLSKNVAQETPFLGGIMGGGRLPIQSAIPYGDPISFVTDTAENVGGLFDDEKRDKAINSLLKEWSKPLYFIALPVAGGQLKKTNEGIRMYTHELPGSYTDSGRLRFEADTSPLGMLQSFVFGQYASENAREYFDQGYSPLTEKQLNEAMDANLPIAEYREINKGITEAKRTAKENGESQSEAQYNYIYNLPISMEQKNSLINSKLGTSDEIVDDNGYIKYTDGNNTYWYDEDDNVVYNSKYREMSNIDINSLSKYSNKKDLSTYGNYGSLEEFNYANNNPEKYSTIQQISSYDNYVQYKDDIAAIKNNYNDGTEKGKKKAQEEVFNYIDSLPLNQYQKIMLQKLAGGYSIKSYEQAVFDYINNLDLTREEKINIHKELFD